MKSFDAESTGALLAFDRLIPALRRMFVEGCEAPPRHVHTIAMEDGGAATVLIMPAWRAGAFLGIKTINIFPGNGRSGLPGLFSTYVLYDARTGVPLAHIDGNEITARRTAATAALAASYLARPDARRMLLVGAGRIASVLPDAYRQVRPIETVVVWNIHRPKAEALAAHLGAQGFQATAGDDLAVAAREADVVSCATLATEPLLHGAWLAPGTHLDLIGSFTPAMREADDACFAGASLFVDSLEALQKSGELLGPISRGVLSGADVRATLADLCRGTHLGRSSSRERTVFKSVGSALEDLAAATLVYEQAA